MTAAHETIIRSSLPASLQRFEREFLPISYVPDAYFKEIELGAFTGWTSLDEMVGGFRKGELTVITGDTAVGKTTFSLQLLYKLACKNYPIWINSYEMAPQVVFRKLASFALKKSMKCESFSLKEQEQFFEHFEKKRCFLNQTLSGTDMATLRDQLERAAYFKICAVLLDHLYFLNPTIRRPNAHEEVQEIMHELHILAMEFGVHLFVIVHPKQKEAGEHNIGLNDLKGGSSIKQYADNILSLGRMDRFNKGDNRLRIHVLKNRFHGTEGELFLKYNKDYDGFDEK